VEHGADQRGGIFCDWVLWDADFEQRAVSGIRVGICGGFTTFSSFSLQTFDLVRTGAWGRALMNVVLSVAICFCAVAVGHYVAERMTGNVAVAQIEEEENAS
jgi:protein CrcB